MSMINLNKHRGHPLADFYRKAGFWSERDQAAAERSAFDSAFKSLEPEDRAVIGEMVRKLAHESEIRNFGELGALNLLAKLGIFLNSQGGIE